MRKMATIRKISAIESIPEANKICVYLIDGWKVVDSIGKYQVDDLVVFCEIDSFIPNSIAPFLTAPDHFPKEYLGVQGERLRSKKFKQQISQGLILPMSAIPENPYVRENFWNEFDDVSELLGIVKYEPPVPAQLAGQIKGNFPSQCPKTDQERCLSGDTVIETGIGKIKISDIVNNRLVCNALSFNASKDAVEYMPVIGYSVVENDSNWIEFTLDNGTTLTCTEDHKIWSDTACGYVEAQQLSEGDTLMVIND